MSLAKCLFSVCLIRGTPRPRGFQVRGFHIPNPSPIQGQLGRPVALKGGMCPCPLTLLQDLQPQRCRASGHRHQMSTEARCGQAGGLGTGQACELRSLLQTQLRRSRGSPASPGPAQSGQQLLPGAHGQSSLSWGGRAPIPWWTVLPGHGGASQTPVPVTADRACGLSVHSPRSPSLHPGAWLWAGLMPQGSCQADGVKSTSSACVWVSALMQLPDRLAHSDGG